MTFIVTLQLRVAGDDPESVIKLLRARLGEHTDATLEELRIKQAISKRGGESWT